MEMFIGPTTGKRRQKAKKGSKFIGSDANWDLRSLQSIMLLLTSDIFDIFGIHNSTLMR